MPEKQKQTPPDTLPPDFDGFDDAASSSSMPTEAPKFSLSENVGPKGALNFAKGGLTGLKDLITHPGDAIASMFQAPAVGSGGIGMNMAAPPREQERANLVTNTQQEQAQPLAEGLRTHPASTLGELLVPMGATAGLAKGFHSLPGLAEGLRPRSISLNPAEAGASELGKALGVDKPQMGQFRSAAEPEAINVINYAKLNDLPIKGTADFAKAARAAANSVQEFYSKNMLEPAAKAGKVSVRGLPTDLGEGEGRYTSLRDIDQRLTQINDELRKPVADRAGGKRVPTDPNLQAEHDALANVLYENVAKAVGATPEAVKAMRQRYGRLHTIAGAAEQSYNADLAAEGRSARGGGAGIPGTKVGMLDKLSDLVQGGREVRGNRQLLKALPKISGTPTPFPQLKDLGGK